jgi:uncharacterized DUF497 family protein
MYDGFEWNPAKAATNVRKHGVSFEEASTVFDDAVSVTIEDDEHSYEESAASLEYCVFGLLYQGIAISRPPLTPRDCSCPRPKL